MEQKNKLHIYNQVAVALILTSLLLWGTFDLLSFVKGVVYLLLLAIALSYVLIPVIRWFSRLGINWTISILLGYLTLFLLISTLLGFIIPLVVKNLSTLIHHIPTYVQVTQTFLQTTLTFYHNLHLPTYAASVMNSTLKHFSSGAQATALSSLQTIVLSTFNVVTWIEGTVLSIVLSFYLLHNKNLFHDKFLLLFPVRTRQDVVLLLREMNHTIEGFIQGQLIIMAFVGVSVTLGLVVIGTPYAFLLGFLSGIFEVVPYLGTVLGAAPALIVALFVRPISAVFVLLLFVIVNQLEGHIVSPAVVGNRLKLSPFWVIVALLAGVEVHGIVGMMLSVPIAALLRVLLNFLYQKLLLSQQSYDTSLPTRVFCPSCHNVLLDQWVACPHCGHSIN